MTLPTSRDITLGATDPIPSSLLNRLQDVVIGRKFPSTTFYFPARAFTQLDLAAGGTGVTVDGTFHGDGKLSYRLPFEPGTQIESISWATDQGNNASGLVLAIEEQAILVPTFQLSTVFTLTSLAAGHRVDTAAAAALDGIAIPSLIPAGFVYSLFVQTTHADHKLYGVTVTASRL